jgi:hypothetical protein
VTEAENTGRVSLHSLSTATIEFSDGVLRVDLSLVDLIVSLSLSLSLLLFSPSVVLCR